MADTVALPGVGPVKKPVVIGGVIILAVILGVAYYRHAKNASATAAASSASTTPDPNAVDPTTGLTYGEEAAGVQAGDLSGYGSAYGDTSGVVGYDAQGNPVYSDQVGYGPTPSFVTNASWAQAAQQYLVDSTGADAGTVAAALGAYLAGQPLTQAQATVVRSATGFFGTPPDAGSNGYPPSLRMAAPQAGGTGGGTATAPRSAPSLSATGHQGFADFGWSAVAGADNYDLQADGHGGTQTHATHAEHITLSRGRHSARVRARNSAGYGPWSASKTFTVT